MDERPPRSVVSRRRLALLVAAAAAGSALWVLADLHEAFLAASRWLETLVRPAGGWAMAAFVALAGLSALLAPFSSAPVVPVAVLAWGRLTAGVLLFLGWLLGGVAAYAIGRFAAYPAVGSLVPWARIEAWRTQVPHGAGVAVAVLIRLALPSEVGYLYGLLRYDFGRYLLVTALAELPVAVLLVQASDALIGRRLPLFLATVALGLLAVGVAWRLHVIRHPAGAAPPARPRLATATPAAPERSPAP